jgi:hypothetical protein
MYQPAINQALQSQFPQLASVSEQQFEGGKQVDNDQAELRGIWVAQLLARQAELRKQYLNAHPLEVSAIGQKFFAHH